MNHLPIAFLSLLKAYIASLWRYKKGRFFNLRSLGHFLLGQSPLASACTWSCMTYSCWKFVTSSQIELQTAPLCRATHWQPSHNRECDCCSSPLWVFVVVVIVGFFFPQWHLEKKKKKPTQNNIQPLTYWILETQNSMVRRFVIIPISQGIMT